MTTEAVGMRFDEVVIDDGNEEHVTAHGISVREISQVFANSPVVRRNRKNRAADYVAEGKTDGGSVVLVFFDYEDGAVRPITAWRK
jgi:uncharacterized DUF497 family protein